MKSLKTMIVFGVLVLLGQQAAAEVYCNIDFQDHASLDKYSPFSYYGFMSFPPSYTQSCETSNVELNVPAYGDLREIHSSPEDPVYWNCFALVSVPGST